ncbi:uroporphyrinogen decarboxylase/cobalamine-independent methonine synthase family protein [Mycobacterium simulans]
MLKSIEAIAASLANYAREAIGRGTAGIFLSLGAATGEVMSVEEYRVWCRPFDLMVLEAVSEAPFNVLHIHGKDIHFDSLVDYPVSVINWSHHATQPSLSEGSLRSGKTVMGGIDEARVKRLSPPEIRGQFANALKEVGTRGLIIAPGCSLPYRHA